MSLEVDRPLRWTAAGLIPARGVGYWSATIPLVLVELDHGALTVRIRPAWFGKFAGTKILKVTAGEVQTFRVRNTATYKGIEFRPPRRSSFYFFTSQRDGVLAAHGRGRLRHFLGTRSRPASLASA